MKKLRVYIADADAFHVNQVRKVLSRHSEFEVIGDSRDGHSALRQITAARTDLLLVDLQLPGLDGLTLLKAVHGMRHPPVCVVCTRFYSDISVSCALKNGAAFVLYKPLVYTTLPELLLECHGMSRKLASISGDISPTTPGQRGIERARVRRFLSDMGIPATLNGSQYLVEAMAFLRDNPALMKNLSKGLYAAIAQRMETTPSCVERALRHAIGIAYARDTLRGRFATRPSNKAFLEYLLEALEQSAGDTFGDMPPSRVMEG